MATIANDDMAVGDIRDYNDMPLAWRLGNEDADEQLDDAERCAAESGTGPLDRDGWDNDEWDSGLINALGPDKAREYLTGATDVSDAEFRAACKLYNKGARDAVMQRFAEE